MAKSGSFKKISGSLKTSTLIGTSGDDSFRGYSPSSDPNYFHSELMDAGLGNDTAFGFNGGDTLLGGAGTDSLVGGTGNDVIDGGTGSDTVGFADDVSRVSFAFEDGILTVTTLTEGTDKVSNAEFIRFGSKTYSTNGVIARDDIGSGTENDVTINVLDNDASLTGSALFIMSIAGGIAGVGDTVALMNGAEMIYLGQGNVGLKPGSAAFDHLSEGQSLAAIFTYTVMNTAGYKAGAVVQVTITGTDDNAVVSEPVLVDLTEGETVSGLLSAVDADGPDGFVASTVDGQYGTFSLLEDGSWTYVSALQTVADGVVVQETFAAAALDGTQTSVTVSVTGVADEVGDFVSSLSLRPTTLGYIDVQDFRDGSYMFQTDGTGIGTTVTEYLDVVDVQNDMQALEARQVFSEVNQFGTSGYTGGYQLSYAYAQAVSGQASFAAVQGDIAAARLVLADMDVTFSGNHTSGDIDVYAFADDGIVDTSDIGLGVKVGTIHNVTAGVTTREVALDADILNLILADDPSHVALSFAPVIDGAVSPLVEPMAQAGVQFSDYDALGLRVGKDSIQLDLLFV